MKRFITAAIAAMSIATAASASDFTECVFEGGASAFGATPDPVYKTMITMQADILETQLIKVMREHGTDGAGAIDLVMRYMSQKGVLDYDTTVIFLVAKGCAHQIGQSF